MPSMVRLASLRVRPGGRAARKHLRSWRNLASALHEQRDWLTQVRLLDAASGSSQLLGPGVRMPGQQLRDPPAARREAQSSPHQGHAPAGCAGLCRGAARVSGGLARPRRRMRGHAPDGAQKRDRPLNALRVHTPGPSSTFPTPLQHRCPLQALAVWPAPAAAVPLAPLVHSVVAAPCKALVSEPKLLLGCDESRPELLDP